MDYRQVGHTIYQIECRFGSGRHIEARGYFCATVRQMTEEMIKRRLEHHFEPNANDDFKMEPQ